jgi:hypothetical protein
MGGYVDVAVNNARIFSLGREHRRCPAGLRVGVCRRDGVNGDTKDNATLSAPTSTLMQAQSTIEGSVRMPNLVVM